MCVEETIVKNGGPNFVNQLFRGKFCGQIICERGHVSEHDEAFYTLRAVIKGKTSLVLSLRTSVEGELLDGDNKYMCSRFVVKKWEGGFCFCSAFYSLM